jgi:hypothetical protein
MRRFCEHPGNSELGFNWGGGGSRERANGSKLLLEFMVSYLEPSSFEVILELFLPLLNGALGQAANTVGAPFIP